MKWIPTSERLPQEWEAVLVCEADGDIGIGCVIEVNWERVPTYKRWRIANPSVCADAYGASLAEVIAWQPLPQPYTADRKDEPQERSE